MWQREFINFCIDTWPSKIGTITKRISADRHIHLYHIYDITYISALNEINLKRGVGLERLYFNGFNTVMRTRFDAFDVLTPNF